MSRNTNQKSTHLDKRSIKITGKEQMSKLEIIDELDKKILKLLISDARLSFREIARHLNLSTGTVIERLRRLEREKIIENYSAYINPVKVGFPLTVVLEISNKEVGSIELEKYLAKQSNICSVYEVTGRTDIVVIGRFRNVDDLNNFIHSLHDKKGIAKTETLLVLDVHKEDFTPQLD